MNKNIIIILCDQLSRSALSCYGDPNISTPNIDRLANEGVKFKNACSTFPVCVPFRFTMMTGQTAHSRGVPAIDWRMSPAEHTMADDFNAADYETVYIGKWHLSGGLGYDQMNKPVPRVHQGRWEKWFGFEFRNNYYDTCYFIDDDPTPHKIDKFQTDGLFDITLNYLDKYDNKQPFACVLSPEAPHGPCTPPPEFKKKWLNRKIKMPPNFMFEEINSSGKTIKFDNPEEKRQNIISNMRMYYAMIDNLDWNVGRLMSKLTDTGLIDDTIVVFLSDHGDLNGSHSLQNKQYPFEESIGIPLLISGGTETGIPRGISLKQPFCTEDILPTVLGLVGLQSAQDNLPGEDLSPLIKGAKEDIDRPGVMLEFVQEIRYGVPFFNRPYRGFRSERFKYTVLMKGDECSKSLSSQCRPMTPWQFYDLEKDPCEMRNLIDHPDYQELIKEHHKFLYDRMVETDDEVWLGAAYGLPDLNKQVVFSGS